jgi:hypothetical protein
MYPHISPSRTRSCSIRHLTVSTTRTRSLRSPKRARNPITSSNWSRTLSKVSSCRSLGECLNPQPGLCVSRTSSCLSASIGGSSRLSRSLIANPKRADPSNHNGSQASPCSLRPSRTSPRIPRLGKPTPPTPNSKCNARNPQSTASTWWVNWIKPARRKTSIRTASRPNESCPQ